MKKLLLLGLLLPWLGGCGTILYKTFEATDRMIDKASVRPEVVQNQLRDPFGTPFPGAYKNGPKTIVAEKREEFYGAQNAYGTPQQSASEVPISSKLEARFSDSASYIREKWVRWGWVDGAPTPGVAYELEELTFEERRVILTELCSLYALENWVSDCASIFEAMCRVESGGCKQIAFNPEKEANARDGMGGSHGWFQIRLKVHGVTVACAYNFRCAAEWAIRYAIQNGIKSPPGDGQSWEDARIQNLVTALWRHNGAVGKKKREDYLDAINTRLHEVSGKVIVIRRS